MTSRTLALTRENVPDMLRPILTYGQLTDETGALLCVTLEPPPRGNGAHRAPAGAYVALRCNAPTCPEERFMVTGIPCHRVLELAAGNTVNEAERRILIGRRQWTFPDGQPGISGAAEAFESLMAQLRGVDLFTLIIRDPE